jgi:hypothetical protein
METKRYYHGHLDRIDDRLPPPSPTLDVTEAEIFVFLAITVPTGHCIWNKLTGYWAVTNQLHTRFYSNAMKRADTFTSFAF